MILGIGTDLTSVDRIKQLMTRFEKKFLQKIFTKNEIISANKISALNSNNILQAMFYAKRFAAKEAFAKALGLGIGRGINFCDIEIFNDKFGQPKINILNDKELFVKNHFKCQDFSINLSLTDEKNMAMAFVIISKNY